VALNFNTDADGDHVGVLTGAARISQSLPDPARVQAYIDKYTAGIQSLEMTPESMLAEYSSVVLITPDSLRGF